MVDPRASSRRAWDRAAAASAILGVAAVAGAFLALVGHVLLHGASALSFSFLIADPSDAGREGGIAPILVSTVAIVAICMVVALPIGVATAVVLAEHAEERAVRVVQKSLDTLAGVPSIVFGLFGNALFCKVLGLGFSILSGGLTLACMVLPLLIRATEAGLRAVPVEIRRGAAALGLSRWTTLRRLLLPAAIHGIVAGVVLGVGRAIAETAALVFTSGYVDRMPSSPFDSGRALSVHIFDLSMNVPGGERAAYGSALVLVGLVLAINVVASTLARRVGAPR